MKRLVQMSVLLMCVSAGAQAQPVDFSKPLSSDAVEALAIGGTLKQKHSDVSLRAICVDQDQGECKMTSLSVLTEQDDGNFKVQPTHEGVEKQVLLSDIQTFLDKGHLGSETGRFDPSYQWIPCTATGVAAGLIIGVGTNSTGVALLSMTTLGAVGAALDVVSAPVRLPINLIKEIVYAHKVRKFFNSIVENDHDVVVRMNAKNFNPVANTGN